MTVRPDVARVSFINDIIRALKTAGLWTKFDVLYFTAAHDAQAARLNWISSSNILAPVNSPTFTPDRGYTGGGTSYLDTGANPSTQFTRATLNSSCYGAWATSDLADSGFALGDANGASMLVQPRSAGNAMSVRVNDDSGLAVGSATSLGMTVGNRSGSAARQIYRNGVSVGSDVRPSVAMPTTLYLLRRQSIYWPGRIGMAFAGASLNATEQAALYGIANTYMTGVGAA
ncbi:hypothetical protein V5F77_20535 [Xanthobacter sp. DSM 24535]|uniref:hypothetical protein n=1 Tax=Roseixanthobacter psychrophilus TaxID=3119917 RepID=UPI00372AD8D1